MSLHQLSRILGSYLIFLSLTVFALFLFAISSEVFFVSASNYYPKSWPSFLITFGISFFLGIALHRLGKNAHGTLYRREGLVLVVLIWFLTGAIGALPFWLSGTLKNPIDAYFESISGLTTTGASVMVAKAYDPQNGQELPLSTSVSTDPPTIYSFYGTIDPVKNPKTGELLFTGVEAVGKPLLLWRSFLHLFGGIGIIVLFLAILPILGIGGKLLYQAEVPGPLKDAFTPRVRETAILLFKINLALNVLQILLLIVTNPRMPLFDAICTSFATIATGGFSTRNNSIAAYESAATEWVVTAFMLIGSINFFLYVFLIKGKLARLKDPEFLVFIVGVLLASGIVALSIWGTEVVIFTPTDTMTRPMSFADALRYGCFNLVSLHTTTGFYTANYDIWPPLSQVIMITVMFIGGMSGSTAGGIKTIREAALVKVLIQRIESVFRPHAVRTIRIGTSEINLDRSIAVLSFFFLYILATLLGTLLLVMNGVDQESAFTVNASTLGNVGAAFRAAGPLGSFAFLPNFSKIVCILWMILGRLEFYALLILCIPDFWRKS